MLLIICRFLIGGNGKVYEGAGWNFVGAHTKGYNDKALGIAFIGDYRSEYGPVKYLKINYYNYTNYIYLLMHNLSNSTNN